MKFIGIAIRNLTRQKRRTFLLGGAIAFGILIITLINGCTGGVVYNLERNFSDLLAGHIFIQGYEKSESGKNIGIIKNDDKITQIVKNLDVNIQYTTKRSSFQGNLIFEGESIMQKVDGVNWEEEEYLRNRLNFKKGDWSAVEDRQNILISDEMANQLSVDIGDRVLVKLETVTGQQNVGEFTIGAIFVDTGIFGSISAYADLKYVNELINVGKDEYVTIGLFLDDMNRINEAAQKIHSRLGKVAGVFGRDAEDEGQSIFGGLSEELDQEWEGTKYHIYTINDILSQAKNIINTMDIIGLVVLILLLLIIMVGIVNTFRMIVHERTKEIGTMRALGVQRVEIRNIFLLESIFLALFSVALGLVFSFIAMQLIGLFSISTENALYLITQGGHLTFKLSPLQMLGNVFIVAVFSVMAAYLPARKAAKFDPAAALRKSY